MVRSKVQGSRMYNHLACQKILLKAWSWSGMDKIWLWVSSLIYDIFFIFKRGLLKKQGLSKKPKADLKIPISGWEFWKRKTSCSTLYVKQDVFCCYLPTFNCLTSLFGQPLNSEILLATIQRKKSPLQARAIITLSLTGLSPILFKLHIGWHIVKNFA